MRVAFDIPDAFAARLAALGVDPGRAALEALVLEGYRSRQLSEAQVRRMLGLEHRLAVHDFLAQHDVPLNYSVEDWEQDKVVADEAAGRGFGRSAA